MAAAFFRGLFYYMPSDLVNRARRLVAYDRILGFWVIAFWWRAIGFSFRIQKVKSHPSLSFNLLAFLKVSYVLKTFKKGIGAQLDTQVVSFLRQGQRGTWELTSHCLLVSLLPFIILTLSSFFKWDWVLIHPSLVLKLSRTNDCPPAPLLGKAQRSDTALNTPGTCYPTPPCRRSRVPGVAVLTPALGEEHPVLMRHQYLLCGYRDLQKSLWKCHSNPVR